LRQRFEHNGECVGNLRDLQARAARRKGSGFRAHEPRHLHVDVKSLPQMADGEADQKTVRLRAKAIGPGDQLTCEAVFPPNARRSLFVAIDRATRWVFIRIFKARTAANARRFLLDLENACPIRIRSILTDRAIGAPLVRATMARGKGFTDRLFGLRRRAATGTHEFDRLCAELGIEHRLTPPASPQTNGMVERFNGRIEEVLQSHHVRSGEDLETTLHRYVWLYNHQLPQSALGSKPPLQAMKDWYTLKLQLLRKQPYYFPECYK
jgi:transposase InsO family protein